MAANILKINTTKQQEMVDITFSIARDVEKSRIKEGICTLFVPHTTCGITLNENADPDVKDDILASLDKIVPLKNPHYKHREGNSAAHIKSILIGNTITIPIVNRTLTLGTWQGIFLCEFDGPRERSLHIRIH